MDVILLAFYGLVLVGFILFVLVVEKYKRAAVIEQERANHLDDVLASAPEGYFYEISSGTKTQTLCSRRLCLMLNIIDTSSDFDAVLDKLSSASQTELSACWDHLHETGTPFELVVQNTLNLMHFKVRGTIMETPYKEQTAALLWFENISYTTAEFTENALKFKRLSDEKETLQGALNALPFPLSLEKEGQKPFLKNAALIDLGDEDMDLHWHTYTYETSAHEKFTVQYAQDKTTEENLNMLLADAERAHHLALREMPCPICLFDAGTRLVFYNKAFADLWKLDISWLKKEPRYDEFLNKMQEKGYLSQIKDFAQYKKVQLDLFARLTKPFEDFIYLENGRLVRRLMIPHAKGGILFIDECKGGQ